MKKLFVSVPMKGLAEEVIKQNIIKMHRIAEAYECEELELINSWVDEVPPTNCNIGAWYLGKSIEKLAMADVFIGVRDTTSWPGCRLEAETAKAYNIKSYRVDNEIILDSYVMLENTITNLLANYNTNDDLRSAQTR